jgi:hypothetical protein
MRGANNPKVMCAAKLHIYDLKGYSNLNIVYVLNYIFTIWRDNKSDTVDAAKSYDHYMKEYCRHDVILVATIERR